MSSCISGGSRTYGFERGRPSPLQSIAKAPVSSNHRSPSSSSSTLSDSNNATSLTISTKKSRTPRKRPNQIYNEAAVLLSTAYPAIFSPQAHRLPKLCKQPNRPLVILETKDSELLDEPSPRPFSDSCFILLTPNPPEPDALSPCPNPASSGFECNFTPNHNSSVDSPMSVGSDPEPICPTVPEPKSLLNSHSESHFEGDFDTESLLDEELGCGIDSILGEALSHYEDEDRDENCNSKWFTSYNNQVAQFGWYNPSWSDWFEGKMNAAPLRRGNGVEFYHFAPRQRLVDKIMADQEMSALSFSSLEWVKRDESQSRLWLKLNHEDVLNTWSDQAPLYADEQRAEAANAELPTSADALARLTQFDVFPELGNWRQLSEEGGSMREASVMRYKEKRRTRLFSKKIRYEVRKVNADRRPRMKASSPNEAS
ncbi:protein CHLOROPLAST IMPORT APPARATUS 2 isoform X2 [Amborella trichopoda]|uniref:protein CHLOROPLAST IMPORT APPARATUS 2 isoform X2 n=1 Tax=Amborella trichopoda TaxID=13333 RepID=UPI0005D30D9A|nr:protein CHLOROPLAST IMPORT APPARATUS 2 isoform X2 [Amborella trichopoda]|eukprot:XP_011625727.1 protein CHLOROPLAST IMPORT APPARATUS 2 isoform X2 [Amborella trichopoda]